MAKKKKNESKRNEKRKPDNERAGKLDGSPPIQLVDFGIGTFVIGLLTAAPFVSEGTPEQFQNWILFFLWLVVLAAVVSRKLLGKDAHLRFGKVDYCFYGVCLWICLSGVVTFFAETGHARPTLNSTWQWFGYAVAFFTLRQLAANPSFRLSAWSSLFVLAVGLSACGIYQRVIVYPAVWEGYQELSEDQKKISMRNGGLSNVEKGSRERMMWENRLHATEPTATFVLANSLAAYLAPWIIIAIGIGIPAFYRRSYKTMVAAFMCGLPMILCLVLTKSRTAYLAVAIGFVIAILFLFKKENRSIPWKLVLGAVVLLSVLIGGAFVTGAVDRQVVTEAFKSLSYRLEYWQSSLAMIWDHLVFGIGPGNFQHNYAQYQLVQASETVSDPHNFFFEIWAIGGTPAMLFLVAGIVFLFKGMMAADAGKNESHESEEKKTSDGELTIERFLGPIGLAFGAGLASFIALLNGGDFSLIAIGGLVAVLISMATITIQTELVNEKVSFVALFAFGVALLASGGVGFPSVAMTGILILALGNHDVQSTSNESVTKAFCGVLLVIAVMAVILFRATVFDPIRSARIHSQEGEMDALSGRLEPAIDHLESAIRADPYDGNFLFFKLQLLFRRFQMQPTVETIDEMANIAEKSATVRPNNSKVTLESGKIFLAILISRPELNQNIKNKVEQTVQRLFEQSTDRRPNDSLHAAYRAFAYEKLGDDASAQKWAEKAMELDALNPHQDKDLKNLPFRLDGYTSERSVEQELERIRKK